MPSSTLTESVDIFLGKLSGYDGICELLELCRWPAGVICPQCGSQEVARTNKHVGRTGGGECRLRRYSCNSCRRQNKKSFHFTVLSGTALQGYRASLFVLVRAALYLLMHRNGVSTLGLSHFAGCSQKVMWHLQMRLGYRCRPIKADGKLRGRIVVDVGYWDGLNKWRRIGEKIPNRLGVELKAMCVMVQIAGEDNGNERIVRALPVGRGRRMSPSDCIKKNVAPGSTVYTDDASEFEWLGKAFRHRTVNHSREEYARNEHDERGRPEKVTTNHAESIVAALKIKLRAHRWVSPQLFDFYLQVWVTTLNQGSVDQNIWTRVGDFFARVLSPSPPLPLKAVRRRRAREKMTRFNKMARANQPPGAVQRARRIRRAAAWYRKRR